MRDLGSGSAVLADANRKPCGEDVFGCVQIPVMGCSAVRARPCPDFEAGHALRPGLRPAVGADLRARIIPIDGYDIFRPLGSFVVPIPSNVVVRA